MQKTEGVLDNPGLPWETVLTEVVWYLEAQDKAVHEGTDVSRGLGTTIQNTDLIIHPLSSYPAVAKNAVSIKIFVHSMLGGPQLSVRDVRGAKKTRGPARPEP